MKPLPFIIFFSLFIIPLFSQDTDYPGQSTLSREQLQKDHLVLIQSLESIHPNLDLFLPSDSFKLFKKELLVGTEQGLSSDEWHVRIREFLRQIGCGHTVAKPSSAWYTYIKNNAKLLPFSVFILDGKAYINEAYDRDSLLQRGTQILAIDGRSTEEILADMLAIQERDGRTNSYSWFRIQRLFTTYYLFLNGQKESYNIRILNDQEREESLVVYPGKKKKREVSKNKSNLPEIHMKNARFYIDNDDPSLGILDIDRFSSKGFKKFYKAVFKDIEKRRIKSLVLDLRNNGGGYFPNGNNLLQYLLDEDFKMTFNRPLLEVKKPKEAHLAFGSKMTNLLFNLMPDKEKKDPRRNYALNNKIKKSYHFTGDLYVLTNGGTFSLGSYVSTYLKHRTKAVFIGSETGGGEFGSNAVIKYQLTLPESGIRLDIPYYFLNHRIPRNDNFGRGVQVDHETKYSISDLLHGRDKDMDTVKNLLTH